MIITAHENVLKIGLMQMPFRRTNLEDPLVIGGISAYQKRSRKAKKRIVELFGSEKIIIPIGNNSMIDDKYIENEVSRKLKDFIKENYSFEKYSNFLRETRGASFFKNKIDGMKLTKKIKPIFTSEEYKDILKYYSSMKNSFSIPKTNMIISTDPLDFANMGVGKNWQTCYSYYGSNYTGTYSTGIDKYSFLIYLTSNMNEPNGFKTYRRTATFSKDYTGIILSKAYPYSNSQIDSKIISVLEEILSTNFELTTTTKYKMNFRHEIGSQVYFDFQTKSEDFIMLSKRDTINEYVMGEPMFCIHCRRRLAQIEFPLCEVCENRKEEEMEDNEIDD